MDYSWQLASNPKTNRLSVGHPWCMPLTFFYYRGYSLWTIEIACHLLLSSKFYLYFFFFHSSVCLSLFPSLLLTVSYICCDNCESTVEISPPLWNLSWPLSGFLSLKQCATVLSLGPFRSIYTWTNSQKRINIPLE